MNSEVQQQQMTFEEFYQAYEAAVRIRAHHLLRARPDLIDDAIQISWIKIWHALPSLQYRAVKRWIWRVVGSVVVNTMRREKRRVEGQPSLEQFIEERGDIFLEGDPCENLPDVWARQEARAALWKRVSERDRQVLLAEAFGKQAVDREALYRARRNFQALKGEGPSQRKQHSRQQQDHLIALYLGGMTLEQAARKLDLTSAQARSILGRIYKAWGVHSKEELRVKMEQQKKEQEGVAS